MKLDGKTNPELVAMKEQIISDPSNRDDRFFPPYTKQASRKLEQIDLQITHNLAKAREAAGNPVPCDGYSGRRQNRRR